MTILIVIAVAVVAYLVVTYVFVFSGKAIGPRYKKFLQETQSSLLLGRFPNLTQGDLYVLLPFCQEGFKLELSKTKRFNVTHS
jgi:hypothetical protein